MNIKAGVLSDTHLLQPDRHFRQLVDQCFAECDIIIHAGDLTDISVVQAFAGKTLYAVQGNMCSHEVQSTFPLSRTFSLGRFKVGLTHGARLGFDIESRLWEIFPEVDCMIYGHTHRPVCHTVGSVLIVNPGSFQSTGRYGASGTYAILEAADTLTGTIHSLPCN
ncbi:MAG: YfcE family phosphodiesterase [Desulfobulbus propionicus]|nr:MAG: YfcE family phosphodiesterase [Desulfobulbus propionicus]